MALHWNVEKIENYETVCYTTATEDQPLHGITKGDRVLSATTESLVHAADIVGLGSITADNWKDFYARVSIYEDLYGAMRWRMHDGRQVAWPIAPEEVHQHIGLTTNAHRETPKQFLRRISSEAYKSRIEHHAERFERYHHNRKARS